jgi:hypothetical protein
LTRRSASHRLELLAPVVRHDKSGRGFKVNCRI